MANSRKKPGPKPKPPEQVRNVQVKFMVTADEKALVDRAAEILGLAKGSSELIREAALKRARQVVEKAGRKR